MRKRLVLALGLLLALVYSQFLPASGPRPLPVGTKVYSLSKQSKSVDYQYNVCNFFGFLSGVNCDTAQFFEGSIQIAPEVEFSVNETFGPYEGDQNMRDAPGIGDGACNAASMVREVLAESGLEVWLTSKVQQGHVINGVQYAIPGVAKKYWTTVFAPGQDILVRNPFSESVWLNWRREGDTLSLWVSSEESPSVGGIQLSKSWVQPVLVALLVAVLLWPARKTRVVEVVYDQGVYKKKVRVRLALALGLVLALVFSTHLPPILAIGEELGSLPRTLIQCFLGALLLGVLFWPLRQTRAIEEPLRGAFGKKMARVQNAIWLLSVILIVFALIRRLPFYALLAVLPFLSSLIYFWVRSRWRKGRRPILPIFMRRTAVTGLSLIALINVVGLAVFGVMNPVVLYGQEEPKAELSLFEGLQGLVPPSSLPYFEIDYYLGGSVTFYAPQDVWDAVVAASEKHGCDARLVIAVANSESPRYNNTTCSGVGACGVWQFMPGTWNLYWPPSQYDPQPSRHNIEAAADAACRMVLDLNLQNQKTRQAFVRRFSGADGGRVWNFHSGQANYVWTLWQRLITETSAGSAEGANE